MRKGREFEGELREVCGNVWRKETEKSKYVVTSKLRKSAEKIDTYSAESLPLILCPIQSVSVSRYPSAGEPHAVLHVAAASLPCTGMAPQLSAAGPLHTGCPPTLGQHVCTPRCTEPSTREMLVKEEPWVLSTEFHSSS